MCYFIHCYFLMLYEALFYAVLVSRMYSTFGNVDLETMQDQTRHQLL